MRYQIKDKHNFFIREDGDSSMVLFKEKHDQYPYLCMVLDKMN